MTLVGTSTLKMIKVDFWIIILTRDTVGFYGMYETLPKTNGGTTVLGVHGKIKP
jgi:hypothetical protein